MKPVLREGDATVFESDGGKSVLVDVLTGKRTEFASAEECWRALQARKKHKRGEGR